MLRTVKTWAALTALCGLALTPLCGGAAAGENKTLKVGFVYVSPVGDEGWSYAHDQGRKAIDAMPGVETTFMESVPEGPDSERAFLNMARKGYDVIVGTSFGYMDSMEKVAGQFPKTTFMHCSGYKTHENMTAYFGRMYQARYLTGMVAGSMTRKNEIGYVAAFPIPEVIRGINAFTLGARAVNPDARVRVVWTRTWYSPDDEKKAAESLLDVGVDVIAQHQDSAGPQEAAEARGVYSVGYNTDMSAVAPGAHLTSAVWRWEDFYKNFIAKVQAGEWKNGNFWYGLDSGLVGIAPYGAMVPQEVRDRVAAARQDIIDGSLVVCAGPVRDQDGRTRIAEGALPEDSALLGMDWFVEGVLGTTK